MSAQRPPAIKKKMYVEIDKNAYITNGEFVPIGEPIVAPEVTTQIPRGKFEITYTAELFDIIRTLGNKKMEVFCYLLDKKDTNNQINTNQREIAANTGTSTKTVNETIRILTESGLVQRKGSVYMMSPALMVKGNQMREAYLMRKFVELSEEQPILESEIDSQLSVNMNGDIIQVVR